MKATAAWVSAASQQLLPAVQVILIQRLQAAACPHILPVPMDSRGSAELLQQHGQPVNGFAQATLKPKMEQVCTHCWGHASHTGPAPLSTPQLKMSRLQTRTDAPNACRGAWLIKGVPQHTTPHWLFSACCLVSCQQPPAPV